MPRQPEKKGQHGGARPGAGRPLGSTNALELGEVRAIKAAGLRVPPGTDIEARELADECLQAITDVVRRKVNFKDAPHVLKAATRLREEICNPLMQKVEHSGPDGGPLQVVVQKYGGDADEPD